MADPSDRLNKYCDAVLKFYDAHPWKELLRSIAEESASSNDVRDLLFAACESWLRKEHVLPLLFSAPQCVKWTHTNTLPRFVGIIMLLLRFGMIIPVPFQTPPSLYRPIPGDDALCAEMCMFMYRSWDEAYREWRRRDGDLLAKRDFFAKLSPVYREPLALTGEVMIDNDTEAVQFVDYFEHRVTQHIVRSFGEIHTD